MTARWACRDLTAGYRNVTITRNVQLELDAGQVLAILGPNGAGKTTLLLTMAGFLAPIDGEMLLDGAAMRGGSARRMNKAGVVLVPDSRALFTQLTTKGNLELASKAAGPSVDEAFDLFPALQKRAKLKAGMLSGGEQQMLAVARALVQGPRVLLIDEMSMGLAPIVVNSLMPIVRTVADETGAAVILVEQHVHLALEVADDALVLVHGQVTMHGSADQLRSDPGRLEAAYLSDGATNHPSGATKAEI